MLEKAREIKAAYSDLWDRAHRPKVNMNKECEEHQEVYSLASQDMWKSYLGDDVTMLENAGAYLAYPKEFTIQENGTLPPFEQLSGLSKNVILSVSVLNDKKEVSFSDYISFKGRKTLNRMIYFNMNMSQFPEK